jgi:hypothetical protein
MYVTAESNWKPNSKALESDRPYHAHTATDVVTQQYSSATFVSLRSHSRKKEFGTFKKCPFPDFHF